MVVMCLRSLIPSGRSESIVAMRARREGREAAPDVQASRTRGRAVGHGGERSNPRESWYCRRARAPKGEDSAGRASPAVRLPPHVVSHPEGSMSSIARYAFRLLPLAILGVS